MKLILAPDSFKESLSARAAALAMERGVKRAIPDAETVVLPIRILTTVSMGTSGMALTWDLVLKPQRASDDARGTILTEAVNAALYDLAEAVETGRSLPAHEVAS